MAVTGVRSSWLASAVKRRCVSNDSCKRSSMLLMVTAISRISSRLAGVGTRCDRSRPDTRAAAAVTRFRGCSARLDSSHTPAPKARNASSTVRTRLRASWSRVRATVLDGMPTNVTASKVRDCAGK